MAASAKSRRCSYIFRIAQSAPVLFVLQIFHILPLPYPPQLLLCSLLGLRAIRSE